MNKDEIKTKISILVSNLLSQNPDMSESDIQVAIYEKGMSEPCENGIIGKIRTEITDDIHKCNNTDMAFGMQHTLDIIDKYKEVNE